MYFISPILSILLFFGASASPDDSGAVHLPLEKRLPKPLIPGTSRGFPHTLRIHEPIPAPPTPLHALVRRVRQSLQLEPSTHTIYDAELFGGMVAVGEYYAKVYIGGQMLRVQIDTGSATLAVPLKQCTHCKRGDLRYSLEDSNSTIAEYISCEHDECSPNTCSYDCGKCSSAKACCSKADDSNCAFYLNFGDGSGAQGMLVRDQFAWGGASFPVTFGGIASDSDDFERSQVDGILGMAYSPLACNPSCITPTFDAMRNTISSMKDYFTICITEDSGRIVLGDYDPTMSSKSVSEITWVPLQLSTPPTFYSFPIVGKFKMDEKEIDLPDFSRAIVDSGTTLIVVSEDTFDVIKKQFLSNYCDVPGLCGSDSWFQAAHCTKLEEDELLKLPTLTIPLTGFDLKLGPKSYMINYSSKGPDFWCVGIMSLNGMSGGVDVILGNVVMNKYVTIYDRDEKRIGFVESDTKCGNDVSKNPSTSGADDGSEDSNSDQNTSGYGGASNDGDEVDVLKCATARNCSECASVEQAKCKWSGKDSKCVPGSAPWMMCTFAGLESGFVYIVGSAAAAVIAAVAVVAILVQSYRTRRGSDNGNIEGDGETQEYKPLDPGDTELTSEGRSRNPFSVGDEEP